MLLGYQPGVCTLHRSPVSHRMDIRQLFEALIALEYQMVSSQGNRATQVHRGTMTELAWELTCAFTLHGRPNGEWCLRPTTLSARAAAS